MPALFTPWQKQYYVEIIEAKAREIFVFCPPSLHGREQQAAFKAALDECLLRGVIEETELFGSRRPSMARRKFKSLHPNIERIQKKKEAQKAWKRRREKAFQAMGFQRVNTYQEGYSADSILQVLHRVWGFTLEVPDAESEEEEGEEE